MKKKKTTEKHLFARICRVLGRFLMCIGAITAIGLSCLGVAQLFLPKTTTNSPNTAQQLDQVTGSMYQTGQNATISPATHIISAIVAIACIALIVLLFWRALQKYNDGLRKFIAQLAKYAKVPIFTVEICLSLLFWALATIIIAQSMPAISVFAFFALIINEFFFIFAWAAYGRPVYTL